MVKAFWTQVMSPPFLNLLPFAEAITTGLTDFEFIMVGAWAKSARGATATVKPAAALERTNRRLFMSDQTTERVRLTISTFPPPASRAAGFASGRGWSTRLRDLTSRLRERKWHRAWPALSPGRPCFAFKGIGQHLPAGIEEDKAGNAVAAVFLQRFFAGQFPKVDRRPGHLPVSRM